MFSAARRRALFLFVILAFSLTFTGSASAQSASPSSGPSQVDRAVTLTSPGVVFIDTSVKVHVRLIFQNSNAVSGLGSLSHTYSFDYATGSGFVVTPNGAIITASHVVEPEAQSMQNYAANQLVLEGYHYTIPSGHTPFEQFTLPVAYQNQLLQQCYHKVACDFTITPIETVYSAIDVAQGQLPKGAPARILTSTGFANTDVAVLQVNGTNMPTVALGQTASDLQTGDDLVALGFPGTSRDNLQTGVTQPNKVFGKVSNIRPQGTSNLIEVDANIEPGMSGGPVIDSAGDVIGLISFSTVQASGQAGAKYLRTIDDIRAALASAGVTPSRGPVDTEFASAMNLFWGNHFTAAAPALQKVLDVYPGHPLATQYLALAQEKAGTKQDVPLAPPKSPSKFPTWVIAVIAAVVVVIVVVVLMSRRKKTPVPVPVAAAPAPIAAVGTPQDTTRSVGFTPPPAATSPSSAAPPTPQAGLTPPPPVVTSAETGESAPSHFCSNCGHALKDDARFCPSCGHPVED